MRKQIYKRNNEIQNSLSKVQRSKKLLNRIY